MMIIAVMLVGHFVADFLLQSREMGKKKSIYLDWLIEHAAIQFLVMATVTMYFVGIVTAYKIAFLNALVHGVIDWNIWKLYKLHALKKVRAVAERNLGFSDLLPEHIEHYARDYEYWDDHWFYVTIGTDQLLHSLTLIVLASLFT